MTADDQAQADALVACTERAEKRFSAVIDDARALESKAGEITKGNWRVGSDGHFVLELPSISPDRKSPFLFTCAGNTKRRVIEMIELDGKSQRPEPGESWSY